MFDFLKNKKNKKNTEVPNEFLNIENSVFNTEADGQTFSDNADYQRYVYQEPIYNIPKYKAENLRDIGVVVDSDQIGFDKSTINPNVKMIELPNNEESNEPIVFEEPIEEISREYTKNGEEEKEILPVSEIAEPISVHKVQTNQNNSIFQNVKITPDSAKKTDSISFVEDEEKISLFGSKDGYTNKIEYSSLEQFEEEKKELQQEVEYTKEGYKICPNCGAILNPDAPVCFMCSKSFILRK